MKSKAVLFDCDGVLVDTETVAVKVAQKVLNEKGVRITAKRASQFVGKADVDFFTEIQKEFPTAPLERILLDFRRAYVKQIKQIIRPMPGIVNLVKRLHKTHTLGLVSGSRRNQVDIILETLGIQHHFKVVITQEDCSHFKPHPEPYLIAARKLKTEPRDCIVIEDSKAGIRSARVAGMQVIALQHTNIGQDLKEADLIVQNSIQLKRVIK